MTDRIGVPLTDPRAQYLGMREEIDTAISRVLTSGHLILGPEVEAFESEFADYIGAKHGIGVANGTDAIAIALSSLGIGPGDEVITVSHTAVASVAAIEQVGAVPVLVDVEPGYLTMDPLLVESAVTDRTRAVMPVHIYGQAAALTPLQSICSERGLALIEDASQAHGAKWRGDRLGSIGQIGIFSCYPTKNLGALGDAGIIVTSDADLATRMRGLRQYGWGTRNWSLEPGVNSRLDELQAAVLRVKLRRLDDANQRRRDLAAEYDRELVELPITGPATAGEREHVFHLYVVEVDGRDALQARLSERGIQTSIHYPSPIHLQPAYFDRIRVPLPMVVTEAVAPRILSLPMYPEMTATMQGAVIEALRSAMDEGRTRMSADGDR